MHAEWLYNQKHLILLSDNEIVVLLKLKGSYLLEIKIIFKYLEVKWHNALNLL